LARFRQTERRRQDPDTEDVSDVRLDCAANLRQDHRRIALEYRDIEISRAEGTERPPIRGSALLHRHYYARSKPTNVCVPCSVIAIA
jgi:hypothetical protein